MKSKIKIILAILALIVIMTVTMGLIDYRKTIHGFERPVFAQLDYKATKEDGGSGTYKGIGYRIEIEGNFMPEDEFTGVTHARFYAFSKQICYSVRD